MTPLILQIVSAIRFFFSIPSSVVLLCFTIKTWKEETPIPYKKACFIPSIVQFVSFLSFVFGAALFLIGEFLESLNKNSSFSYFYRPTGILRIIGGVLVY